MKALVVNALGGGFDLEDVDIAAPIGREVLVDVRASGLCHTDLLFAANNIVPFPAVFGHEVSGDRRRSWPGCHTIPRRRSCRRLARAIVRIVRAMPVRPLLPVPAPGSNAAAAERCAAAEPQRHRTVPGLGTGRLRRTRAHPREPARPCARRTCLSRRRRCWAAALSRARAPS